METIPSGMQIYVSLAKKEAGKDTLTVNYLLLTPQFACIPKLRSVEFSFFFEIVLASLVFSLLSSSIKSLNMRL
jgi:hypothetical protein